MTIDDAFRWRVEQACLNAWPAPRQALVGNWLVRLAGGPSRRINSVNPLQAVSYDPAEVIAVAAPLYAALHQPLLFRVPDIATGLDDALAARSFEAMAGTLTLFTGLDDLPHDATVEASATPSPEWLALRARLNDDDPVAGRAVDDVIASMVLPRAFVGVRAQGVLAAIAMGGVDRGLLVVEAVGTAPAARGRGYARRAVAGLMAWARSRGAQGACLQVLADNAAGRRLYDRLGFHTDLYHYAYRRQPL